MGKIFQLRSIILLTLLFVGTAVFAQKKITGKITSSEDGQGLPGATVVVKGTDKGSVTDLDGAFSLDARARNFEQQSGWKRNFKTKSRLLIGGFLKNTEGGIFCLNF